MEHISTATLISELKDFQSKKLFCDAGSRMERVYSAKIEELEATIAIRQAKLCEDHDNSFDRRPTIKKEIDVINGINKDILVQIESPDPQNINLNEFITNYTRNQRKVQLKEKEIEDINRKERKENLASHQTNIRGSIAKDLRNDNIRGAMELSQEYAASTILFETIENHTINVDDFVESIRGRPGRRGYRCIYPTDNGMCHWESNTRNRVEIHIDAIHFH